MTSRKGSHKTTFKTFKKDISNLVGALSRKSLSHLIYEHMLKHNHIANLWAKLQVEEFPVPHRLLFLPHFHFDFAFHFHSAFHFHFHFQYSVGQSHPRGLDLQLLARPFWNNHLYSSNMDVSCYSKQITYLLRIYLFLNVKRATAKMAMIQQQTTTVKVTPRTLKLVQ